MSALNLLLPDGQIQKVIVRQPGDKTFKRNPHAAAEEFRILQIVRAAGALAPAPYLLDSSGEIFAEPYLVIEYIEGEPRMHAPADVAAFVRQMAAQLATIHRLDSARVDLSFFHNKAQGLLAALRSYRPNSMTPYRKEQFASSSHGHGPCPQRTKLSWCMAIFGRATSCGRRATLSAVIDWEDAEVGNPLVDFAISRLDILWIFGPRRHAGVHSPLPSIAHR